MASPEKFYERISRNCMEDLRFIGEGGFGTIWWTRHKDWRIKVAVKILKRDASCTREELLREARAMEKVRFTYIPRLFGLFVDEEQAEVEGVGLVPVPCLGLVMEFMENGSLSTLQSKVPSLPWALRVRILHQVALGMNFLHSLCPHLLHLDLKPSNVLLDGDLHIRVTDFGLSKFRQRTTSAYPCSSEEECGGTLAFMPPEAFQVSYKPSRGTDVYSYGILMWSVLAGEEPYSNVPRSNLKSLIRIQIPQGQRPNTEELEKKIHEVEKIEGMIALMKRCWHNERAQRPPFQECSQEMEDLYSCYKAQIVDAVHQVQVILMPSDSSLPEETRPVSGSSSRSTTSCIPPRPGSFQSQLPLTSSSQESPSRQNGDENSQVQITHVVEGEVSLDNPDGVGPSHVGMRNPNFTPSGDVQNSSSSKQEMEINAVALLYQLTSISNPVFHLYLLPNDPSLRKAVHDHERIHASRRVPKPPETTRPLKFGSRFFVQTSDNITVYPKELEFKNLDADLEQQYLEVYTERMQDKLELSLIEKNKEEVVWEACVRRDELKTPGLPFEQVPVNGSRKTVRDHLVYTLEDLLDEDLKRFKGKLKEHPGNLGFDNIPKGQLQKADAQELSDLLLGYYEEINAVQLTVAVLENINLRPLAKKLLTLTGFGKKREVRL